MVAYMNDEAFNKTLQTGETWFYSRRRKEVWKKGAEAGNVQKVRRITADSDRDAVLIIVDQYGHGACDDNKEEYSSFHNLIMADGPDPSDLLPKRDTLGWLYATIEDRAAVAQGRLVYELSDGKRAWTRFSNPLARSDRSGYCR